jgi:hypothetical protein
MMTLPNEPDPPISELCKRVASLRRQRFRIKVYCTARWSVQRGKQVQKSAFAGTRGPDDGDHFSLRE